MVLFFQFRACNISILAKRAQWMLMKDYTIPPFASDFCTMHKVPLLTVVVVGPWRQQLWWCWSQVILLSKDKGYYNNSIKSKLYSWNLCFLWLSPLSSDCGYVFMKRCTWLIQTRISEIAKPWPVFQPECMCPENSICIIGMHLSFIYTGIANNRNFLFRGKKRT